MTDRDALEHQGTAALRAARDAQHRGATRPASLDDMIVEGDADAAREADWDDNVTSSEDGLSDEE